MSDQLQQHRAGGREFQNFRRCNKSYECLVLNMQTEHEQIGIGGTSRSVKALEGMYICRL